MADHVRTRAGGAVLLHRLGALNYGEQSRWDRAPERHGLWAFPWPHFEMFFAYHQYSDRMPVRLRRSPDGWPAHPSAWADDDGNPPPPGLTVAQLSEDDAYSIRGGWHDEREEWVRQVGRRVVRKRTFWHTGQLYTHLTPRGDILALDQWRLMPAVTFAEAVRRSGADKVTYRIGERMVRARSAADHLEVFLPRNARR